MFKKPYALAIVSILLIPVATLLGGVIFSFINPDIAAGHPNYERNYRLLALARLLAIWASWLVNMGWGCYAATYWSNPKNNRMHGCLWPCLVRLGL
jgi:hypothetical protein